VLAREFAVWLAKFSEISADLLLVYVAPHPALAGFERPDDGVAFGVRVPRRMTVLRRIAAADVPAMHAQAQVDPSVAGLQAVFATALLLGVGLGDLGGHVLTGFDGQLRTPSGLS